MNYSPLQINAIAKASIGLVYKAKENIPHSLVNLMINLL